MTIAEDLSLLEAQQEFVQRYQDQQADPNGKYLPMLASSCPGKHALVWEYILLVLYAYICCY